MGSEDDQTSDLDLEKKIDCPKCDIVMQQIIISEQNYSVTVDRCNICDGYWFDRYELEKVLDEEMKEGALQYEDCPENEADFRCPRCNGTTETKNLYNIKVDLCLACGGIWLDKGELEDVQKTYRIEQNQLRVLALFQEALEA